MLNKIVRRPSRRGVSRNKFRRLERRRAGRRPSRRGVSRNQRRLPEIMARMKSPLPQGRE